ncbi:MAG TPA: hypothetical protein VJT72_13445 [Pseudonocardiaceae bacterium]|nr:hypothetical protein [Pseudonocardiaceae bacterium]
MSHPVSFAELDGQHVELLPARTILSLFSVQDTSPGGATPEQVAKFTLSLLGLGGSANDGSSGTSSSGVNPS